MAGAIVVFCASWSHYQRLDPMVRGFRARGLPVVVYSVLDVRTAVEECGADFSGIFERFPLEAADSTSRPRPCRYVTHAAHCADTIIPEVARLEPSLILYDTFAVLGPLVARVLNIPHVNVSAGHNRTGSQSDLTVIGRAWDVLISPQCERAVERLREDFGISDANPFWFLSARSPHLNVYCEPPEFLTPEEREIFEPVVYFGCLPFTLPPPPSTRLFGFAPGSNLKVFVCLGSVVWELFPALATEALETLARELGRLDGVSALISLGHRPGGAPAIPPSSVESDGVRFTPWVKQWDALNEADLFITHHGVKSTHESVLNRVPMVSYPLFGDQFRLAERCQEMGLAVPLTEEPRQSIDSRHVVSAINRFREERTHLTESLAEASKFELRTMAEREAAIDRILSCRLVRT